MTSRPEPDGFSSGLYHRAVRALDFDGGRSDSLHLPGWPRLVTLTLDCGHQIQITAMNYRDDTHMDHTLRSTTHYCSLCAYTASRRRHV